MQNGSSKMRVFAILMIIAVVMAVVGVVQKAGAKKVMAKCTETAIGTYTDVESKRVRTKRSSHMEYRAIIEFEASDGTKHSFKTEWTSVDLTNGTSDTVHYDPDDPDTCYSDRVPPTNGFVAFVMAAIMAVSGVISLFAKPRNR